MWICTSWKSDPTFSVTTYHFPGSIALKSNSWVTGLLIWTNSLEDDHSKRGALLTKIIFLMPLLHRCQYDSKWTPAAASPSADFPNELWTSKMFLLTLCWICFQKGKQYHLEVKLILLTMWTVCHLLAQLRQLWQWGPGHTKLLTKRKRERTCGN